MLKGISSLFAILLVLIIVGVGISGYILVSQSTTTTTTTTTIAQETTTSTTTTIPIKITTSSTTTSTLPLTTISTPTCIPNYVKIGTISKSTLEALGADDYGETCKYHFCRNQYDVTSYKIEMTTYYGEEAADCYCDINNCNP